MEDNWLTDYLIYVYHRASIACKVNIVKVPRNVVFELCCFTRKIDWTDLTWIEEYEGQDDKEFLQVETLDTWSNYEPELFH